MKGALQMLNNAIHWITYLENPEIMIVIGILAILFHTAFRPNFKKHIECLDDSQGKNRKPVRTRLNHAAFLFEGAACFAIVYYQGVNVFTMLICFWSFVTWVPSYISKFRYTMRKRKFNKVISKEA